MAGRMDLEARLRALREGKRPPASPPAPPPPVPTAASFSWPEVPSNPVKHEIPIREPVAVDFQPVRRASASFSAAPAVTIMSRSLSDDSASSATSMEPPRASESVPVQEEVLRLTPAQLLGPDYEEAVKVAQYAIDSERRQMPHTAIDAYIRAGQILIEIGRQQAAPHLQDIVKMKALALLQRAEGLSEWTNKVLANESFLSKQQVLAAAYQQSHQNRNRSLTEKQELVSKMQQDNQNMKERLNQLALLTKIRGRMMKVVKKRRARKAEEAKAREEMEADAAAQATRDIMRRRDFNDVTGEFDDDVNDEVDEDNRDESNNVTGSGSDEDEKSRTSYQHYRSHFPPTSSSSPREAQKIGLINELHDRIGLPQLDHLRTFEPLTNDPTADKKQEELQSELEAAKLEADKLRAAVQEMEQCLRLAAQHSKQRSIKLEQQKAEEFAEVQSELDRVKEELEFERRRSASFKSSPSSWRSSVVSDPGAEDYEDTGVMRHLRSSLHKVFRGRDEHPSDDGEDHRRRASIQRTSYSHDSPRNNGQKSVEQAYDVNEEDMEAEDDGGVWL